jgi:hypothetical protein
MSFLAGAGLSTNKPPSSNKISSARSPPGDAKIVGVGTQQQRSHETEANSSHSDDVSPVRQDAHSTSCSHTAIPKKPVNVSSSMTSSNGSDNQPRRRVHGHPNGSVQQAFDESKEWDKISEIIASISSGLSDKGESTGHGHRPGKFPGEKLIWPLCTKNLR